MGINLSIQRPAFDEALLFAMRAGSFLGADVFSSTCRFGVNQLREGCPDQVQSRLLDAQAQVDVVEGDREGFFVEAAECFEY